MMRMNRSLTTLLALVLLPLVAAAETRISLDYADAQTGAVRAEVLVADGRIRMRQLDEGQPEIIFDAASARFSVIDHGNQSITEFDQGVLDKLSATTDAIGAQLGIDLGGLLGGKSKKPNYVVERSGEFDQIAGIACEAVVISRGTNASAEACLGQFNSFNIDANDRQTILALATSARSLAGKLGSIFPQLESLELAQFINVDEMPLRFDDRSNQTQFSVTGIETLGAGTIDVSLPQGYTPYQLF